MSSDEDARMVDIGGRFVGRGTWRDSAGNRGDYDVVQTNRVTECGFEIRQVHVHGGAESEIVFALEGVAPYVFRVDAGGQGGGFGFAMNDVVRFHFNNHLGGITEIAYQANASGVLAVYGSTDRNSDGNYIMWHEQLRRAAAPA